MTEVTTDIDALLRGLNDPQREAVTYGEGPLLILAGAGSGKTRVLTHRIAYLVATDRAKPNEILAITFTNKAAAEMRDRAGLLVGRRVRAMWVMTFHSACARMLRAHADRLGYTRQFTIYDQADSRRLGAIDHDAAVIGIIKAGQEAEQRGFAAAVLADQGDGFAVFYRQIDAGQNRMAGDVRKTHVLENDRRLMRGPNGPDAVGLHLGFLVHEVEDAVGRRRKPDWMRV